jgi:hypothetical protein
VIYLGSGLYSIYVQSETYGFNATLVTIDGPTIVRIPIGPYVMGCLVDDKRNISYCRPTDPSLVERVIFGINQTSSLPLIRHSSTFPQLPSCYNFWTLYNDYYMGQYAQLQGAVYSWGPSSSDQIQNTPTPSQYSVSNSYVSYNGGGFTQSGSTSYGVTSQETLTTACQYCGSGYPFNYDVAMLGTWHDYVYHEYNTCYPGRLLAEKENTIMTQGGHFYQWDWSAWSTNDYSFSYFYNLGVGQRSEQTVYLTLSTVGTSAQGFSEEFSACLSSGSTGGEFSGCFNVGGYTSLNSGTSGTTVMYTIAAYDYCGSFEVYKSGWVLGWSQGGSSC